MELAVSTGVGLQDANAGRCLLKPLEKYSSEATPQASKTAGSPQQSSIELAVSTGVRLQDIVELTMSTVKKGATLSLALPLPSAGDGGFSLSDKDFVSTGLSPKFLLFT